MYTNWKGERLPIKSVKWVDEEEGIEDMKYIDSECGSFSTCPFSKCNGMVDDDNKYSNAGQICFNRINEFATVLAVRC